MKIILAVAFALTFCMAGISAQPAPRSAAQVPGAQKPAAPAAASGTRIDAAKEADIRRLLELVGTKAMSPPEEPCLIHRNHAGISLQLLRSV
jgi:hypothetical protein